MFIELKKSVLDSLQRLAFLSSVKVMHLIMEQERNSVQPISE